MFKLSDGERETFWAENIRNTKSHKNSVWGVVIVWVLLCGCKADRFLSGCHGFYCLFIILRCKTLETQQHICLQFNNDCIKDKKNSQHHINYSTWYYTEINKLCCVSLHIQEHANRAERTPAGEHWPKITQNWTHKRELKTWNES